VAEPHTANDPAPRSTVARLGWTILIIATLYVCYFSHLSVIGFVGPDEPRYAWIARDMAESGDWVTPRLYGKPWFEKPILYYWSAAVFFKLSGVQRNPPASTASAASNPTPYVSPEAPSPDSNSTPRFSAETAARLPSAIYALLATLSLAWLALRIYGSETARWLLLLLPTTVGMIGFSHAAATDMPFSATLTIAMVFAAILLRLVPDSRSSSPSLSYYSATNSDSASSVIFPPVREGLAPPADTTPTNLNVALDSTAPPSSTSFAPSTSFASLLFGFFLGLAVLAKGPAALILSGGAVFLWALFTKRWPDAFRLFHPVAIISFCLTALPWYILCARRNPDFFRVFIIEHNFKRYLTPEFQHIQPFWYYGPIVVIALIPWIAITITAMFFVLKKKFGAHPYAASIYFLCWACFSVFFFSTSHSKLPGYILPSIPAFGILTAVAAAFFLPRWKLVLLGGVVGLLLFFEIAGFVQAHSLDYIVSPRHLAEQIQSEKQVPIDQLTLSKANRTERYVLSFYFRRQIQDWDQNSEREAYVLVTSIGPGCEKLSQNMDCSDLWGNTEAKRELPHLVHLTPKTSTSPSSPLPATSPKNK
jgi:4-amino-4-deoxy-L-arabinose transferase-like glycosyltransferase